LGGGNALGGAAGAGVSSALASNLNGISNTVYDASPTGDADTNRALGNILANVLAGGAGAVIGGNAGAFAGANEDLYNRSTSCNGAHCDDSNAIGKQGNTGDAVRVDLVNQYCGAGKTCTDAQLKQVIQAQAEMSKAIGETTIAGASSPNYATVGASTLSGSGGGAINLYDGTRYVSAGVTQTFPPASWALGFTGSIGWILGARDAQSTNAFLNGDGNQAFISIPTPWKVNAFAAITHGYGSATAIEVGVTTPSGLTVGVTPWSHSVPLSGSKK
jgi:filamentous hemagglutinin